MKKYLSMAALLMSGFMFLTACSSDDDSSSSSSSSGSSKVVSSGTSAAEVVAQAQQNGSVTVNATSTSAVAATVTISSDAVTGAQGLDNGEVAVNVQQTDGNGYTVALQPTSAVFSAPVEVALPVSDPDGTIYTYTLGGQTLTATVQGGLLKASVLSFNNQLVFTKQGQAPVQGQLLGGYITGLLQDTSRGDIPMPYMHRIELGADGNFTMYEFQNAQGNMMVYRRQGTFAVEGDTILALNVTSFDHTPHYGTEDTEWYGMSDNYEGESLRLPFAFRGENVSVMTPDGWETFVPEATVASSNTVVGRRTLWMSYFNENTRQVQREERVIFDIKDNGQMTISIPVWNGEKWEGTYTTNGQTLSFRVSSVTRPSWEVEGTYSVITRDEMSESEIEGCDFTTPFFFDADGNLYAGVVGLFGVFEK